MPIKKKPTPAESAHALDTMKPDVTWFHETKDRIVAVHIVLYLSSQWLPCVLVNDVWGHVKDQIVSSEVREFSGVLRTLEAWKVIIFDTSEVGRLVGLAPDLREDLQRYAMAKLFPELLSPPAPATAKGA